MEKKHIANLVAQWKYGVPIIEDEIAGVEIICHFDHDFEHHLLVVEYDFTSHNRLYSLWFLGVHIEASLVKAWSDADLPPFAEAAVIVQEWLELMIANSGRWPD